MLKSAFEGMLALLGHEVEGMKEVTPPPAGTKDVFPPTSSSSTTDHRQTANSTQTPNQPTTAPPTTPTAAMPLVMPELFGGNQNTNTSGNRPDVAHWTACLMGKKLGTETNETVRA